jgi:hypothetical protein
VDTLVGRSLNFVKNGSVMCKLVGIGARWNQVTQMGVGDGWGSTRWNNAVFTAHPNFVSFTIRLDFVPRLLYNVYK